MTDLSEQKCGFVAILGPPNAGKSTLLNALVGAKVSIVTPKAQTTRTRVLGIIMHGNAQIVAVDTPGIFKPARRLDRAMVSAAWESSRDAECVLFLLDSTQEEWDDNTLQIVERLKTSKIRTIVALNKIDLISRHRLLAKAAELDSWKLFDRIFMISAVTGDGLNDLKKFLASQMPKGPWLYPEEDLSNMPLRLLAAEITREKIFLQLYQEIPYSCAVEVETWEEKSDGSISIGQVIYIQRASHKPILVGKGGQRIKAIGIAARKELENILECRVHLSLFVKVQEDWAEQSSHYASWGLDFNAP